MVAITVRCFKCKHVIKCPTRVPKLCPFCGKEDSLEEIGPDTASFSDVEDLLK